ncbi:hypothetical protein SAMD00019534_038380, partial [Acytostelium subglobosum LB1]|uniref:hypothetical protein n=1 Tax=Acytostelium subglobosum LB1 TaxID=1410327 RepID=UPI000644E1BC
FLELRPQILEGMKLAIDHCPTCNVLKLNGHSIGGAMLVHAAIDLIPMYRDRFQFEMYTFGSPKVGNSLFVKWFTSTIVPSIRRLTNRRDQMVHLPKDAELVHIPSEIYFGDKDEPLNYRECNDSEEEDPKCSASETHFLSMIANLSFFGFNSTSCTRIELISS